MKIYNNIMLNFQRRLDEYRPDALKREQLSKAQETKPVTQPEETATDIKSPTERLLATYFDIEV